MSNQGSEQSSNATDYSIRVDRNGRSYRSYHPRNPHTASSTREEYDASIPRSENRSRRPSESVVPGASRHHASTGGGEGRDMPIVLHNFSGPGSPPGHYELSRSRHVVVAPPMVPYPPNALGFMASAPPGQSALRASQPDFVSSLTGVAYAFASIDARDYKGCERYMKSNPAIFKVEPRVFLVEALEALKAGKDAYARSCVQQSLLLRDCKGKSTSFQTDYFEKLLSDSDKVRKAAERNFLIDRDEALKKLKERLPAQAAPAAEARGMPTEGVASLSVQDRHAAPLGGLSNTSTDLRHQQHQQHQQQHQKHQQHQQYQQHQQHQQHQQKTGRGEGPRSGLDLLSNAPTYSGETMDENYVVRDSSFFTVGRVFAILWHTNMGGSTARQIQTDRRSVMMSTGRFGEQIISHIQRMVVVKREHGFCWCIPVNTYNGKGVAKKGFNATDRAAHSIIYMNDQSPFQAEDETNISKRSIMVIPADDDQKLDPMSRINFGKVHTVEHNVRVMAVGRVDPKSLPYFEGYWEQKAKESFRKR